MCVVCAFVSSLLSLSEDSDVFALGYYVIVAATGIVFAQHD